MKQVFCIALAALVFGLCGCSSPAPGPEQQRFDRIAASLEPGGTAYFIGSSAQVGPAAGRIRRETERKLWNTPFPPEERQKLQSFISGTELFARLAGLPEIEGWGGSSKRLPDGSFRNRLRLLLAPGAKGIFWQIPGQNQRLYSDPLPPDTLTAGMFCVNAEALQLLLDADKRLSDTADRLCRLLLGVPAKEFFAGLSGVWKFLLTADEEYNVNTFEGLYCALTVPDREGKLFDALAAKAKLLTGGRADGKSGIIQLPPLPGKSGAPQIRKGDGTITFYNSSEAVARTRRKNVQGADPVPVLSDDGRAGFTADRPAGEKGDFFVDGVGFVYNSNAENIDLSLGGPARRVRRPSLGILKRLPDGFLFEEGSPCDLNEYAAISLCAIPAKLAFDIFSRTPPPPPRRKAPAARPAPSPGKSGVPAPPRTRTPRSSRPRRDACLNAISRVGRALLKAAGPQKRFPAPGIAGLRELAEKKLLDPRLLRCPLAGRQIPDDGELNYANCHYLYFGKPGADSPKSPLLMELPVLHRDHCAVFYADGSCEKIRLSEHRNVRRAISFLHTRHAYEEEEFFRLMKLAAEFDKILEL